MKSKNRYLETTELLFLIGFLIDKHPKQKDGSFVSNLSSISKFFNHSPKQALLRLQYFQSLLKTNLTTFFDLKPIGGKEVLLNLSLQKDATEQEKQNAKNTLSSLGRYKTIDKLTRSNILLRALDDTTKAYPLALYIANSNYKKLKTRIKNFLEDYLQKYENSELCTPAQKIYSQQEHLKLFLALFKNAEKFDTNHLAISNDEIISAARKHLAKSCQFSELRPVEYLMLMKKNSHVKIKDFNFLPLSMRNNQRWTLDIALLRTTEEIESIEGCWISFGQLSFRKDNGQAKNGSLAKKTFQSSQDAYKALCLYLENKKKRYSFEEIEKECFSGKLPSEALSPKIDNVFLNENGLNGVLKMNTPESKIAFVKTKGSIELVIIP